MKNFNLLTMFLPAEEKIFYDLFEQSSQLCHESALELQRLIKGKSEGGKQSKIRELRQKSNAVSKETIERLNKTFVTPIDREDIQFIASKLNRINRKITKTYTNLGIYNLQDYFNKIEKHVELLIEATKELGTILSEMKKITDLKKIINSSERINNIENKGDELFVHTLEKLFSGKYDALTVIKLKDIYNSIESALNTCSDISDEVVRIVLKHN
jgi:uncharacterized protein